MPLEGIDQYLQAAIGYAELGMFEEADSELDKIDPFCRALPRNSRRVEQGQASYQPTRPSLFPCGIAFAQ